MTYKEAILTSVNTRQGITAVELVLNCMSFIGPSQFEEVEYTFQLAELVSNKEIVELEYILPQMDYRIKSIYFPKGTKIYVSNNDKTNDDEKEKNNTADITNA